MSYRLCRMPLSGEVRDDVIQRIEDSAFIPATEDNRDWVAYLAWRAEGNDPEPAADPEP